MRLRPAAVLALLLCLLAHPAHAQTQGTLRYTDGTVLPGELVEHGESGGLFRSPRFGDIRYTRAEATFVATEVEPPPPAVRRGAPWMPTRWSVGLSGYWQSDNGTKESDAAVDLDASWHTDRNDVDLHLGTDYRIVDDAVDNNEQRARIRWVRSLSSPWVGLGMFRANRSTATIDPLPSLDYLLLQGTLGLGVRRQWSPDSKTLVALGHEWVSLDLLDYNGRVHTHATSMIVDNNIRLAPRITLDHTMYVYLWRDGDTGVDSQAEVSYALTDSLSVGLRHQLRRNAVNLDIGTFNKVSVTTRVRF